VLLVATGRKGTFPIACSINVGFGVGLAEWGSKSTFALQDSESHMSALGGQTRTCGHVGLNVRFSRKQAWSGHQERRSREGCRGRGMVRAAVSMMPIRAGYLFADCCARAATGDAPPAALMNSRRDLLNPRKSIGPTCSTATCSRLNWFAPAQHSCAPHIIQRKRPKCFGHGRRGTLAGKLQASFGQLLAVLRSSEYIFHTGSMSDLRFRQV
jgi:hypothetical protein